MGELISQKDVEQAVEVIRESPMAIRTPLLQNAESIFGFEDRCKLHLKLESMQNTGKLKLIKRRSFVAAEV